MKVLTHDYAGETRTLIIGDKGPEQLIIHRDLGLNFGDIVEARITAYHPVLKGYFAMTDRGAVFLPTQQKLTEGEGVRLKITKEARMDKDAVGIMTTEKTVPFCEKGEPVSATEMDDYIAEAMEPNIPLDKGAVLHIERTKVCWTLDVDSGKNSNSLFQINQAAVSEIVRQIRLKNMGGIILIDFAGNKRIGDKKRLEKLIADGLSDDTLAEVCGWSKTGLFEIRRKRERAELWVTCSDNNPLNVYYRVRRAIAECRSGNPRVRVAPIILKYLQQAGIRAKLEPLFDTPTAYFEVLEK